jgi:hypothetical protein
MPDFTTEINIEPWEYVSSCNKSEINSLIESLIEEGYISPASVDGLHEKSALDFEWDEICEKIRKSRLLLTSEEENFIKNVSDRL